MTRVQSPAYPVLGLGEAVRRLEQFERSVGNTPVDREAAVLGLGFNTVNGTAVSHLNALRQYGLIRKNNGVYSLGEIGKKIVDAKSKADREAALLSAAWRPDVFKEMRSRFGAAAHTDPGVKAHLGQKGFLPAAVEKILKAYEQTASIAGPLSDTVHHEVRDTHAEARTEHTDEAEPTASPDVFQTADRDRRSLFTYRTETGAEVSIVVRGALSDRVILGIVSVWLDAKRAEVEAAGSTG